LVDGCGASGDLLTADGCPTCWLRMRKPAFVQRCPGPEHCPLELAIVCPCAGYR
jgi:hypothetical protein